MKKFLPFIFPLVALLIVIFLASNWYRSKVTPTDGKISEFGEGVKIEELSQDEMSKLTVNPAKDTKSVKLEGTGEAAGEIRYEVKDDKLSFSVFGELPELTQGVYQVWIKEVNGEGKKKAFVLVPSKSGYMGSAAVPAATAPFEVVVSQETNSADEVMEVTILKGVLNR